MTMEYSADSSSDNGMESSTATCQPMRSPIPFGLGRHVILRCVLCSWLFTLAIGCGPKSDHKITPPENPKPLPQDKLIEKPPVKMKFDR
jgi:hypothetical protein